jgi:hypothetical protein
VRRPSGFQIGRRRSQFAGVGPTAAASLGAPHPPVTLPRAAFAPATPSLVVLFGSGPEGRPALQNWIDSRPQTSHGWR